MMLRTRLVVLVGPALLLPLVLGCAQESDRYTVQTTSSGAMSAPRVPPSAPAPALPPPTLPPSPAPAPPTPELTPPSADSRFAAIGVGTVRAYMPYGTTPGSPLFIERTAPREVRAGDVFEYQIKVTNVSGSALKQVRIHSVLPANLTFKEAMPEPTEVKPDELVWEFDQDMRPGAAWVFTVKAAAKEPGILEPCLYATYVPPCVGIRINVVEPKLELVKSGPSEVLICEPIQFKVVVRNTGSGVAAGIRVTDQLPEGLTHQGSRTVVTDVGALGPGEAKQAVYEVRASRAGTFTNTAVATGDGGLRAEATHKVTVRQPVLVLTKTGPKERLLNRNATYEITVANKGDGAARNTVVVDTLAGGATFVSASDGGQASEGKVVWNLGTLEPNASKTVTVTVRAGQIGSLRNVVSARAMCSQADAEATTEVVGMAAILLEVVDLEDPIDVGQNVTYVITVTNQGTTAGTNIRVVCTIPEEEEHVSSDGATRATVEGKKVVFAPLPSLAPQAKATYRVVVRGVKAGDVRFGVELTSDQMTSPATETESTHIYEEQK